MTHGELRPFPQIDEQRKYLGGDSEHSVLVKGLDFALFEQNKAKTVATSAVEDDEALEQAFLGVDAGTSADVVESTTQPKKKSRQDLIRELKEKRGHNKSPEDNTVDAGIEAAKNAGKFKPIGFKPIGGDSEGRKRKKKEGAEKKKKKLKMDESEGKPAEVSHSAQDPTPSSATLPRVEKQPEPEPLYPDFDIFAGVEEYIGEAEEDSADEDKRSVAEGLQEPWKDANRPRKGGWIGEPKSPTPPPKEPTPPPVKEPSEGKVEGFEEERAPMRLVPLASSFSVKDVLAIDDAVTKEEKRKARKEKKKKKAELNTEAKANRDYQKCVFSCLCSASGRFTTRV
jgi:IK cytokine